MFKPKKAHIREYSVYKPGANVTQVVVDNSFRSRNIYVKSAAVPPPKECPTTCRKLEEEINKHGKLKKKKKEIPNAYFA